ncbi:MAG: Ig-like domain-containing protein [Dysgonamonadaceae bacterium]|jgi:hypothetical protein|nr:Ig-like domain-containing protein [Dysgonamonadaceae bacterium]
MVSNSDLQRWQQAVQYIAATQNELSPEELSTFQVLAAGNFESSANDKHIQILKNSTTKNRLLKAHLTKLAVLYESGFKAQATSVVIPASDINPQPITQPVVEVTPAPQPQEEIKEKVEPQTVPIVKEDIVPENPKKEINSSRHFGTANNSKEISATNQKNEIPAKSKKGKSNNLSWKWILLIVFILAALGVGGYFGYKFISDKTPNLEKEIEETSYPITTPDGITLNITSLSFDSIGMSKQLTITVFPDEVPEENKGVIWQSGDETVATVDENGVVTAINNGNAVISAYTLNGISATCYITVGQDLEVADETLDETNSTLEQEESKTDVTNKVVKTEKETSTPTSSNGNKFYSFGKYSGSMKNGIPDGNGTMTYTKYTRIAKHAREAYYAEDGDLFVGTWGNGDIVSGKLFDRNNNLKATILVGKRPNPYDISKD